MAKQDVRDWFIMLHVGLAANAMLVLCFMYPTNAVLVTAAIGAIATILGLFHWFTIFDDKHDDR